jgi:lipoprotein-releasing system ATP-binding protein
MLFKLNNISKHYGSESEGTLRKVLDGLTLEIDEGERIAILGPSGSGKTTLLNIMGTLDRPDSGDVFFRNKKIVPEDIDFEMYADNRVEHDKSVSDSPEEDVDFKSISGGTQERASTKVAPTEDISTTDRKSELRSSNSRPIVKIQSPTPKAEPGDSDQIVSSKENIHGRMQFDPTSDNFSPKENLVNYTTKQLDTFRNEKIGFVFQLHHLLPQCTLLENILIPTLAINDKKIRAERLIRAKELMERVGIWEQRDQMPGHLSGGECQRAAVVRALINNPGLLLADEPTGALDENNVSKLAMLLLEINKSYGVTLVVVTHSLALASKMDTIYELRNGKLRLKNLKA